MRTFVGLLRLWDTIEYGCVMFFGYPFRSWFKGGTKRETTMCLGVPQTRNTQKTSQRCGCQFVKGFSSNLAQYSPPYSPPPPPQKAPRASAPLPKTRLGGARAQLWPGRSECFFCRPFFLGGGASGRYVFVSVLFGAFCLFFFQRKAKKDLHRQTSCRRFPSEAKRARGRDIFGHFWNPKSIRGPWRTFRSQEASQVAGLDLRGKGSRDTSKSEPRDLLF